MLDGRYRMFGTAVIHASFGIADLAIGVAEKLAYRKDAVARGLTRENRHCVYVLGARHEAFPRSGTSPATAFKSSWRWVEPWVACHLGQPTRSRDWVMVGDLAQEAGLPGTLVRSGLATLVRDGLATVTDDKTMAYMTEEGARARRSLELSGYLPGVEPFTL